jgi:hypothetical protein
MSGVVDEVDWHEWYSPKQEEMANDPLLVAFKNLRNYYEKQGRQVPGGVGFYIGNLSTREIGFYFLRPMYPAEFFIGDQMGRSGWKIHRPNGEIDYRYVELPESWATTAVYSLEGNPEHHLGVDIRGKTIEELADLVINYLSNLLDETEEEFLAR